MESDKKPKITPKTKTQLAAEYHVCLRTLQKWLAPIGLNLQSNRILTVAQVRLVYEHLGNPFDE